MFHELSLFTGAGGGLLGSKLLGWRAVGYVERDPYCQAVLQARIRDGILDPAPIFGDIRQFVSGGWADRYRGMVDVVSAGFPCQPFSVAGKQRAHADDRNFWPETAEVLGRVTPTWALLENVPGLLSPSHNYFEKVLTDLASMGFDAEWGVLGADDCGAPHRRKRLWVVAHSNVNELRNESGRRGRTCGTSERESGDDGETQQLAYSDSRGLDRGGVEEHAHIASPSGRLADRCREGRWGDGEGRSPQETVGHRINEGLEGHAGDGEACREPGRIGAQEDRPVGTPGVLWWDRDPANERPESESFVGGLANGLAGGLGIARAAGSGPVHRVAVGVQDRVNRLRALGNGQVPICAAMAWRMLRARID